MEIKLRLEYLEKIDGKQFRGRQALADILAYLDEQSLLEPVSYYAKNYSSRKKKVKSTKELIDESRDWKDGVFELFGGSENPEDYLIKANLDDANLWFLMSLGESNLPEFGGEILQQWKKLVMELNKTYLESLFFGPTMAVEIYGLEDLQALPELDHSLVKTKDIISIFSKKFHDEHPDGNRDELERLMKSKLPASAVLEEKGDLIILNWVAQKDLADEKVLEQKLSERDKFLSEELNAPFAEGWNEAGDAEVPTFMLSPHPPLTFYDEFSQTGYKAVVVNKKGEGADDEIKKIAGWLKKEQLPDGTPLTSAGIIVPGREQAFLIREKARKAGISEVFYVDDEGRWWNPFFSDK